MKLNRPFCRLPLRFDVERLQTEIAQFAASDWQSHPTGFSGNSAIRLISAEGQQNDDFTGVMRPTPQLARCPYIMQTLAHFGQVWSRSRLMRLAPGARVPEHCDINYHWFHRVRLHIPVKTDPSVRFTAGGETVHMGAGEVWIFDNWKLHEVHNGSAQDRIHLVADTCGNSAFWQLIADSQGEGFELHSRVPDEPIRFRSEAKPALYCERVNTAAVMHPSEVEQLSFELLADLAAPATADEAHAAGQFAAMVTGFCHEWRTLWALFGDGPDGIQKFAQVRNLAIEQLEAFPASLRSATNSMPATEIFYPRVLMYALHEPAMAVAEVDRTVSSSAHPLP